MKIIERIFGTTISSDTIGREHSYKQSTADIVEEIHNSFNTASDRALEEAMKIINNAGETDPIIDQMVACGFNQVKIVKEAVDQKNAIKIADKEATVLNYYKQTYPTYKFIMDSQVKEICEKYGLLCGESHRYKGDIPYKNMQEIAAFREKDPIKEEDCRYYVSGYISGRKVEETYKTYQREQYLLNHTSYLSMYNARKETTFSICAPVKDMDMTRAELKGHKIVDIPDPIVLFPVRDNMWCIVSAWGPEASDNNVVNEKMN